MAVIRQDYAGFAQPLIVYTVQVENWPLLGTRWCFAAENGRVVRLRIPRSPYCR